jgi:hypothetical protein
MLGLLILIVFHKSECVHASDIRLVGIAAMEHALQQLQLVRGIAQQEVQDLAQLDLILQSCSQISASLSLCVCVCTCGLTYSK